MSKFFILVLSFILCVSAPIAFAQETSTNNEITQTESKKKVPHSLNTEKTPDVGKHVMANVDASSMILSLLMVLVLIIISALVLKRFNLTQQHSNQLKVVASLSLGAKERVVVVQIGEQQLVLGVCSQQISLLKGLEKPIDTHAGKSLALPGNILSFLQKNSIKTSNMKKNTDNNITTSETTNK